jgi:NADPH-dependent 2,4-dienoyl-CoA reductase/sulfur reductase-like enzyme/peroxiredoxin family protein/rhodanese-related sulfurtransferase/TusA-related sulfurtransferase
LRRLDENAQIVLLERGEYISYANCGLPYHVGNVIPRRDSLLVMTPERLHTRFNIDVRIRSNVTAIDAQKKTLTVVPQTGAPYQESYDTLLLATGSAPLPIVMPGSDDPDILKFWTIPDMDTVNQKITAGAKKVVVVGAGFIGLEVAENLRMRNLDVTVVELAEQVLPTLDKEMAIYLAQELLDKGIELELGRRVTAFQRDAVTKQLQVSLDNGTSLIADFVIMSVGVKPNSELAQAAGIQCGPRGHIHVNEQMQTSIPDIYAAGDAVEILDPITGATTAIPLAGPANKQGRIAADNMSGKRVSHYGGTFGAAVLKVGALSAASVGLTERRLQQLKLPYQKIYTHPGSHASYYPGAAQMNLKILFAPDGKILGAQGVGRQGVDKRIDVIATALASGRSVYDLASIELAYAPPFNSAKDPVNFLGMIAENMQDGLTDLVHADAIPGDATIIDVREPEEIEMGTIPGSRAIPLGQLRNALEQLDPKKRYVLACAVGLRGYIAERMLKEKGYTAANLSGGYLTWKAFHQPLRRPPKKTACPIASDTHTQHDMQTLDVRALACPGPVVRIKQEMDKMKPNDRVRLLASPSFSCDLTSWAQSSGNKVLSTTEHNDHLEAILQKGEPAAPVAQAKSDTASGATLILFSNDLDKAMAALILACGMAAAGQKATIFFTFWGLSVLRKNPGPSVKKPLLSTLFGWMLPKGITQLALSKMHMLGMGTAMMKYVMRQQNVPSLQDLLVQARQLGVRFVACEMAMNVMGLQREELIEIDDVAGVANFAQLAQSSKTNLFI